MTPCIAVIALHFKTENYVILRQCEEKLRNPER